MCRIYNFNVFILKVIENIKNAVDDTIGVASWKSHARLMKIYEGRHKFTNNYIDKEIDAFL